MTDSKLTIIKIKANCLTICLTKKNYILLVIKRYGIE